MPWRSFVICSLLKYNIPGFGQTVHPRRKMSVAKLSWPNYLWPNYPILYSLASCRPTAFTADRTVVAWLMTGVVAIT